MHASAGAAGFGSKLTEKLELGEFAAEDLPEVFSIVSLNAEIPAMVRYSVAHEMP